MIDESPSVSVIIPSYNYAGYLREAVASVLAQTWQDFELIIADDGSMDASLSVAQEFARQNDRIRVFWHPERENRGLAATLQLALAHARGRYVAILEADDKWHPDCLEKRMGAAADTGAGIVFNAIEPICEGGYGREWFEAYPERIMKAHAARVTKKNTKGPFGSFAMREAFFIENQIPTFSCAMIKRSLLETCNLSSPVPQWVDRWIWFQAAQKTEFAFVPEKLTCWRLHRESYTARSRKEGISALQGVGIYLRRNAKFWRGLRRIVGVDSTQEGNLLCRMFLRLPPSMGLGVRLAVLVRAFGIRDAMQKCLEKLA